MRKVILTGLSALCLTALLTNCKGRTCETVEPDGSAPVEVTVTETESATAARDTLRTRIGAQTPELPDAADATKTK